MKTALSLTLVVAFLAVAGYAHAHQSGMGSHGSAHGFFSGFSGGHSGAGSHGHMGSLFGHAAGSTSGVGANHGGGSFGGMPHAAPAPGRQQAGTGTPMASVLQHGRSNQGAAGAPTVGSTNVAHAPSIAAPGQLQNTPLMGRGSAAPQVALAAPSQQSVQAMPSHCTPGQRSGSQNACPVPTPPPPRPLIVNGFGFFSFGMFPYDAWPLYPMGPYPGYYDSGQDCERLRADPKAYQECLARHGDGAY